MPSLRLSPVDQQRVAVLVPLLALAVSLFVVYPAWGRYTELQSKIEKQRKELADLKAATPPTPGPNRPTVDDKAAEPSEFLGLMTSLATAAECRLVGLDVASGASTRAAAKEGEAPAKKDEPSAMRAVRARVEVTGSFPAVRQFLVQLSNAPRLLVVTDLTISSAAGPRGGTTQTPSAGSVHATVEVERYIAIAPRPPDAASPAAASPRPPGS